MVNEPDFPQGDTAQSAPAKAPKLDYRARNAQRQARLLLTADCIRRGLSVRQTAAVTGVVQSVAFRDRKQVLAEWAKERLDNVDDAVNAECARIDSIVDAHFDLARAGDPQAAAIVLRASSQKATLLGLNAEHRIRLDVDADVRLTAVSVSADLSWARLAEVLQRVLAERPDLLAAILGELDEGAQAALPEHEDDVIEGTLVSEDE